MATETFTLSNSEKALYAIAVADLDVLRKRAQQQLLEAEAQAAGRIQEILTDHGIKDGTKVTFKREDDGSMVGEYEVPDIAPLETAEQANERIVSEAVQDAA